MGYWDIGPLKLGYWDIDPLKLGYLGYRDPPLHPPTVRASVECIHFSILAKSYRCLGVTFE